MNRASSMDRIGYLNHAPIEFYFRQSPNDFVVDELPLYEFSGDGEHLVLLVRKKSLTTLEMISSFAKHCGIKERDIGYAGLKDKHALTKQYISLPKKCEELLEGFSHPNIKILEKTYHNNKIRIGHLKGNRFFIRLKKVSSVASKMIDEALKGIELYGMPNYFGYQRFGINGDNYKEGELVIKGEKRVANKKLREFLISAYQSHLFNLWLAKRVEISRVVEAFSVKDASLALGLIESVVSELKAQKQPFKLVEGDLMMHYPHGRLFSFELGEAERFASRDIAPTGLIAGKRASRSTSSAGEIEASFDEEINADGSRRYAWIFPYDISSKYKSEDAHYELSFSLPKGSYATVLLEQIAQQEIRSSDE